MGRSDQGILPCVGTDMQRGGLVHLMKRFVLRLAAALMFGAFALHAAACTGPQFRGVEQDRGSQRQEQQQGQEEGQDQQHKQDQEQDKEQGKEQGKKQDQEKKMNQEQEQERDPSQSNNE